MWPRVRRAGPAAARADAASLRACACLQGPNIETKTWWLVRDNFRGQAYNMKANMLALNKVNRVNMPHYDELSVTAFWPDM